MRVVFPTPQARVAVGFPPLSANAWAVAKTAGEDNRLRSTSQLAFIRVRLAEQQTPPALVTARGLLGTVPPERELGRAVRKFGLLPGGNGERFISSFGLADPDESLQSAWDRWAAGILNLNGLTMRDATDAARHLAPIVIGCRPPWLGGKPADIWRECWQSSAVHPPREWARA